MIEEPRAPKRLVQLHESTVRFAGDSGDGMQLVGTEFADLASLMGNDISTLSDYPSEIRAPAGTTAGVSGFQLSFGDHEIRTPGDQPDVLVAMNPAALKVNIGEMPPGAIIVVDEDAFTEPALTKVGYDANPLQDGSLQDYRVIPVAISKLTEQATQESGLSKKAAVRCKNFVALGIMMWLFDRPIQPVLEWLMRKFKGKPEVMKANSAALRAGVNYADTAELFRVHFRVAPAKLPPGRYRRVTGNQAAAMGCVAGAERAGRTLVYASYPITPASEILQELSNFKEFDVRTLQCEDEIAACAAAIGASYGGAVGVTGTSGPGLALKTEAIGLAVMTELPLVVVNVQRAGPSTGMPTKSEQADLLMALHGRHGESPLCVMAAATPGDCFHMAFEAVRIAIEHMTPVILLSDSFLANSSAPWRIPEESELPGIKVAWGDLTPEEFQPYMRDPETLVRPWVTPGTPGLEHRIGGLEKQENTGKVTYDADNHRRMVELRAEKIARIADNIPRQEVKGPRQGELLVVGWGSTHGPVAGAVEELRHQGMSVAHAHLRYLNPFPRNLEEVLRRYDRVVAVENNGGQLASILRDRFLIDVQRLNKIEGRPFLIREVVEGLNRYVETTA